MLWLIASVSVFELTHAALRNVPDPSHSAGSCTSLKASSLFCLRRRRQRLQTRRGETDIARSSELRLSFDARCDSFCRGLGAAAQRQAAATAAAERQKAHDPTAPLARFAPRRTHRRGGAAALWSVTFAQA
ncbi:hypothetical protein EYF80_027318 [Liparis tanakae]|uniref:Secreted protein n=1 Tax=Liparis tanakae TaxID=230148 RepID=A0A4Z2HA68_9TELE|nr:hypothetical protein EYF80_027318 [Liparis tanakae]